MEKEAFNYEGWSQMISDWEQKGFSGILKEFVLLGRPISINSKSMIMEHDHALFLNPYWANELSQWLEKTFQKPIKVEVRARTSLPSKTLMEHRQEMMQENQLRDIKSLLQESFLKPFSDKAQIIEGTFKKN